MKNEDKYFSIKHWSEDDQPREKLLYKGKSVLSDAELIAILIGSGSRNESAVDLCKRILKFILIRQSIMLRLHTTKSQVRSNCKRSEF